MSLHILICWLLARAFYCLSQVKNRKLIYFFSKNHEKFLKIVKTFFFSKNVVSSRNVLFFSKKKLFLSQIIKKKLKLQNH